MISRVVCSKTPSWEPYSSLKELGIEPDVVDILSQSLCKLLA